MFACLYLPPPASAVTARRVADAAQREPGVARREAGAPAAAARPRVSEAALAAVAQLVPLINVARDFSPRVEVHGDAWVTIDIEGLGALIGPPRTIGEELRRACADAGLRVHVAVAQSSTAAMLLASARAGLTVVPPGEEASALAPLPIHLLDRVAPTFAPEPITSGATVGKPIAPIAPIAPVLMRWGLRTLGELAALPPSELSARLGQPGLRWQKWARGEEIRPLVPSGVAEQFEESIDLEWPIDGLEPLSFVLARLLDPLCDRLEQRDRGAVVLRVVLTLVSRLQHERAVELPAPMRDARVLRTLALLDLESNPPPEAIDRVTVRVDVTEGRVLQFGLFARALPADTLATLMARLGALMGANRVGSPALVDTHRPGAFTMTAFDPSRVPDRRSLAPAHEPHSAPPRVLRRFRTPIPARVSVEAGKPARVTTERRGMGGGRVVRCEGPWRSSGEWWAAGWNADEWDVALSDGAAYRISQARESAAWSVDGLLD